MESKEPKPEQPQPEARPEDPLLKVLVDKTKKNSRGVPTMNFIESVEDWIDKFTAEKLLSYINQYLNKYKFMEAQIVKSNEGLNIKIPDIEKCLETIEYLEKKEKESADGVLTQEEKNIIEKIFLSHANKDKMTQGKITITPYFNVLKDLGIFDIEKENGELVYRKSGYD